MWCLRAELATLYKDIPRSVRLYDLIKTLSDHVAPCSYSLSLNIIKTLSDHVAPCSHSLSLNIIKTLSDHVAPCSHNLSLIIIIYNFVSPPPSRNSTLPFNFPTNILEISALPQNGGLYRLYTILGLCTFCLTIYLSVCLSVCLSGCLS
jgi:hypothetical protein